jgi:hypothetical protein
MRSTRAVRTALLSALLALAFAASASAATTVIHFQPETLPPLEAQLHKHEVHALTFHPTPAPGHVHVSMNDGRHFTVVYAANDQEHLIALARANGSAVTVATVTAKSTTTHHKLRYIAAGILIVVIVIVAAVLLVDRRRKLREEAAESSSPAPSAPGGSAS